jgi:hypothetical protein
MDKDIFQTIEQLLPAGLTEDEKKYHHDRLAAIQREYEEERLAHRRKYFAKYREMNRDVISARARDKYKQKRDAHKKTLVSNVAQHSKTKRESSTKKARNQTKKNINLEEEDLVALNAPAAAIAGVIVGQAPTESLVSADPNEQLFADFQAFSENQANQVADVLSDEEDLGEPNINVQVDDNVHKDQHQEELDNFDFDEELFGGKRTKNNKTNKNKKKQNTNAKKRRTRRASIRTKTRKYIR